ncbi:MAG: DUF2345 domain-containing protein, partial [Proteobacteria bacterium]|nr:DUF2345 domain-containing protein [Pseudomonadota bacterium]
KLIAAKGQLQMQAQSDDIEITADKNAKFTAIKGKGLFNAKQEILLTAGGAYIRIKDGKIELHAPGKVSIKGGSHDWSGPKSLNVTPPFLPLGKQQLMIERQYHDEAPLQGADYIATFSDGTIKKGVLDANGQAHLDEVPAGAVQVVFGPDKRGFKRKDQRAPKDYKESLSDADIRKLIAKHRKA